MKDYKRLTQYMQVGNNIVAIQPQRKERIQLYIDRLFELEDKIERGELCDREEVRKETARDILKSVLNKMYKLTGCGVPYHVKKFMEEIAMKYGVELFGNSDMVENEE